MAIYYSFFILTERQKNRPSIVNPNPHLHAEMNTKTNTLGLFISHWYLSTVWEHRSVLVTLGGYEISPLTPSKTT